MNQNLDPTGCPTGLDFLMTVGSSHKRDLVPGISN